METIKNNVDNIKNYPYPGTEIMDLFLKIGYKKGLFNTVDINGLNGTKEKTYENINAISTLAVVCDYLGQDGNEKEKESFLAELEKDEDDFYKKMSEFALDIIEKKGELNPFTQSLIQSNRERLQRVESDIRCFPTLSPSCKPKRYTGMGKNTMIHEVFEAELSRMKGVSELADKIQAESENHTFNKGDNSGQISDLENRL